jgi:hypothetical protein
VTVGAVLVAANRDRDAKLLLLLPTHLLHGESDVWWCIHKESSLVKIELVARSVSLQYLANPHAVLAHDRQVNQHCLAVTTDAVNIVSGTL